MGAFVGAEFFRCRNGMVRGRGAKERDERRLNFEASATSAVVKLGIGVVGRPLWRGKHFSKLVTATQVNVESVCV